MLVGCSNTLRAIDAALAVDHAEGRFVTIVGEPGTGKSTLCKHARSRAGARRVIDVPGSEATINVPLAGVTDLARSLRHVVDILAPRTRRTIEALLGEGAAPLRDPLALGTTVLAILRGGR